MENKILKYDIWMINLNPTKWNEQSGIRPCLVIQNDEFFSYQWTTIVLPLTWNITKNHNFWVLLENYKDFWLDKTSFIISFQIRTVSKDRFIKKMGNIGDIEIRKKIKNSLILSLDLEDDYIF